MKYDFKGNSIKEFSKLPRKVQLQIMQKLELYMSASSPLDFAEHLTDFEFGGYRFVSETTELRLMLKKIPLRF